MILSTSPRQKLGPGGIIALIFGDSDHTREHKQLVEQQMELTTSPSCFPSTPVLEVCASWS